MKKVEKQNVKIETVPQLWGSGPLKFGGIEIDAYVLDDGTALIGKRKILTALGRPEKGDSPDSSRPAFLSANNLQTFITPELEEKLKGVDFIDAKKQKYNAYPADILAMICDVYLEARLAKKLTANQMPIAQQCEILVRAFARVGITALIYEQLGFEKLKHPDAFRMLIESYLSEELRKWSKEFPDELFIQMDKIYGNERTTSRNRPMYYAKFIRKYIYDPIEKGQVLTELDKKAEKTATGKKKTRLHQGLNEEKGLPNLRAQIWQVIGVLKTSRSKRIFEASYQRLMGNSFQTNLFEEEE